MNKEKYFLNKINEFSGKLKIKKPFIVRDNRMKAFATVYSGVYISTNKKGFMLKYNSKKLEIVSEKIITCIALHELGHIKTTADTLYERERKADKFALKAIKKYFPTYYKQASEFLWEE